MKLNELLNNYQAVDLTKWTEDEAVSVSIALESDHGDLLAAHVSIPGEIYETLTAEELNYFDGSKPALADIKETNPALARPEGETVQ